MEIHACVHSRTLSQSPPSLWQIITNGTRISPPSDIFSFGVVLWELMTAQVQHHKLQTSQTATGHRPQTANRKPQTTNHKPQTTNLKPQNTKHKPQTTNHKPQPQTTNHKPQTTNHKPQTTNHKPQTTKHMFRVLLFDLEEDHAIFSVTVFESCELLQVGVCRWL